MFVGYPRSGHSLVGALLDAHPDAVIAHELDALALIRKGFNREQIYRRLIRNSRHFAESGREWRGYEYAVTDEWQGRFRKLRVIGDKKGGGSTRTLASEPELLDRLRETVGVEMRLIHVIRNPYDNISTMFQGRSGDQSLEAVTKRYIALCDTNKNIKNRLNENAILDLRHEALVEDPESSLRELCWFLNLECEGDYLKHCASVVSTTPHKSRYEIEWTPDALAMIRDSVEEYGFLRGYSFEE